MKKNTVSSASKSTAKRSALDPIHPKFSNTMEKAKKENQPFFSNLNIDHNIDFAIPNTLLSSLKSEDDFKRANSNRFYTKEFLGDTTETYYGIYY
jgi:hypothetical protein